MNDCGLAVKAKYVRRSICGCGFSVMRDEVPLGKIYLAYPATIERQWRMRCGGCGKTSQFASIVVGDQRRPLGRVPLGILELDEAIA